MLDKKDFMRLFRFDKRKALYVGVERECFLCDESGKIAPIAARVLKALTKVGSGSFGYELSACQLEARVGPCQIEHLEQYLHASEQRVRTAGSRFSRSFIEAGPKDMPLDVYPDPAGRYRQIVKKMPQEILLAACRVIGTHVHVGMPDRETALTVYNRVLPEFSLLCEKGNGSFGERLELYKKVAPQWNPPFYADWEAFYQAAVRWEFTEDPRRCWTLIRISVHGTIEFRMFGATESLEKIASWAVLCHSLCKEAME